MTEGPVPRVTGVLETCLHVQDVEKAAHFYERLFGFRRMVSDERFCAFDVAAGSVLLLFRRGGTLTPVVTAGGITRRMAEPVRSILPSRFVSRTLPLGSSG